MGETASLLTAQGNGAGATTAAGQYNDTGSLGTLLAAQGAGYAAQAANTYSQNVAARAQQSYSSAMAGINARWAAIKAKDAIAKGDINASRDLLQGEQVASNATVKAAAGGTNVASGPAAIARNDIRLLSVDEAIQTKNNAYRQALGLQQDAANIKNRDRFSRMATAANNRNSLLQLGGEGVQKGLVADYYYEKYKDLP